MKRIDITNSKDKWVKRLSKSGMYYYFNSHTGESYWATKHGAVPFNETDKLTHNSEHKSPNIDNNEHKTKVLVQTTRIPLSERFSSVDYVVAHNLFLSINQNVDNRKIMAQKSTVKNKKRKWCIMDIDNNVHVNNNDNDKVREQDYLIDESLNSDNLNEINDSIDTNEECEFKTNIDINDTSSVLNNGYDNVNNEVDNSHCVDNNLCAFDSLGKDDLRYVLMSKRKKMDGYDKETTNKFDYDLVYNNDSVSNSTDIVNMDEIVDYSDCTDETTRSLIAKQKDTTSPILQSKGLNFNKTSNELEPLGPGNREQDSWAAMCNNHQLELQEFRLLTPLVKDRIKCRLEEYVCHLMQILEEGLLYVVEAYNIEIALEQSNFPVLALLAVVNGHAWPDRKVNVASDTLDHYLTSFYTDTGKLKLQLRCGDCMNMFGSTYLLFKHLQKLMKDEEIQNKIDQLNNLKVLIDDPSTDDLYVHFDVPLVEDTSPNQTIMSKERMEKADVLEYVNKHYGTGIKQNETKNKIERFMKKLQDNYKKLKNVIRTVDRNISEVRIDDKMTISTEDNDVDISHNNHENGGQKKTDVMCMTSINVDQLNNVIRTLGKNISKLKIMIDNKMSMRTEDNIVDISHDQNDNLMENTIEPSSIISLTDDDYHENDNFDGSASTVALKDYNGRKIFYNKNEKRVTNNERIDNRNDKRLNVNENYVNDMKNQFDNSIYNDLYLSEISSDSGISNSNEHMHAYPLIILFLNKFKEIFMLIYNFVKSSLSVLTQDMTNEQTKTIINKKAKKVNRLVYNVIEILEGIIEREAKENEYTLKHLLIKSGHALTDMRTTKYSQVIKKCLEQTKLLEYQIKIIISILNKSIDDASLIQTEWKPTKVTIDFEEGMIKALQKNWLSVKSVY